MQIVKSREYRTGFQVGPWDMERLVQHLGGDESVTRVAVELGDGSFRAVCQQEAGEFRPGDVMSGRYLVEEGLVATACELVR